MKTYAYPSPTGLENTCEHDRAFTLTDLLVVLATLAILAALILPVLARSGDNSMEMLCLNNLRQMGTAQNIYSSENLDYMPWPGWGNSVIAPRGWCYGPYNGANNPNNPVNLDTRVLTDMANWPTGRVANLKTGVYWQYLQNPDVFICPVFAATVVGTPTWVNFYQKLTSYTMNGASAFYPSPNFLYGFRTCKTSQIWSPLCIIQWEPNGNNYNDAADYPNAGEGVSTLLHTKSANVLAVGGNANMMTFIDFLGEMNHNAQNVNTKGKGLLWWNPLQRDGHGRDQ